jgi:hypothetical protein
LNVKDPVITRLHGETDPGLVISKPVIGRVTKTYSIQELQSALAEHF